MLSVANINHKHNPNDKKIKKVYYFGTKYGYCWGNGRISLFCYSIMNKMKLDYHLKLKNTFIFIYTHIENQVFLSYFTTYKCLYSYFIGLVSSKIIFLCPPQHDIIGCWTCLGTSYSTGAERYFSN